MLPFNEVVAQIGAILSNPDAIKADLQRAKDLGEAVNQHYKTNPDCDMVGVNGGGTATDDSQTGTQPDTKDESKKIKKGKK